jgi:hypothetical protein
MLVNLMPLGQENRPLGTVDVLVLIFIKNLVRNSVAIALVAMGVG